VCEIIDIVIERKPARRRGGASRRSRKLWDQATARHLTQPKQCRERGCDNQSCDEDHRSSCAKAFEALHSAQAGRTEPRHSLRMGRDTEGPLLVVLGPSFNTGQQRDVADRFRDLDRWVHKNFPVGETVWRWFNEDYDTADRASDSSLALRAPSIHGTSR
jgi:hypothetical protein